MTPEDQQDKSQDPSARQKWLRAYSPNLRIRETGRVESVGDGIAWISGLPSASLDHLLLFEDGSQGMVFDLGKDLIGAALLHETDELTVGTAVSHSQQALSVPAGDELLGRVIDPLGTPLDGQPAPQYTHWQPCEAPSPSIMMRDFVNRPLYSGVKIVDSLIPIARGQRQLIIGDEGLGRSALALQTVINQRGQNVYCVYVHIAQMRSTILKSIELLRKYDAWDYTTMLVADASSLPGLQHLAPFAGSGLAEYWMRQGKDVLVIYDNLSNHAKAYRELSLLLRRPPGREAYPGDIFSVHARLLERATCLSASEGGGSLTALPIIETTQGEIAAYIPTNLISITDGQIYLDRTLFDSGFHPAIDIARSISRIGGQAQHEAIKHEAGRMKMDYLQFLELEVFTRFGARLEAEMEAAIKRGRLLRNILKQEIPECFAPEWHLAWLIAFNDGLLNDLKESDLETQLRVLYKRVEESSLSLDDKRGDWSRSLKSWIFESRVETEHDAPL